MHLPPFFQSFILVPVGFVDDRMAFLPVHRRKRVAGGNRIERCGAACQKRVQLGKSAIQRCFPLHVGFFIKGVIERLSGGRCLFGKRGPAAEPRKTRCGKGPAGGIGKDQPP
ncbi:hypothetical protein D3C71_817960 [compost metagenome]